MPAESGTAMLSIDLQGGDKSFSDNPILIPLPMLNSIILHLGCKGKRKLLCSHRTAQHRHITGHVSYVQDEQDIFSMTSRHQATWSKFPGEKEDLSAVNIQAGMTSPRWHIVLIVPAEQSKATVPTANCSTP